MTANYHFESTHAHACGLLLDTAIIGVEEIQQQTIASMSTDGALIAELVQAISEYGHDPIPSIQALPPTKRAELVRNAERLAIAAREPAENLYFQGTQVRPPW